MPPIVEGCTLMFFLLSSFVTEERRKRKELLADFIAHAFPVLRSLLRRALQW
jgi:hypothetical protein